MGQTDQETGNGNGKGARLKVNQPRSLCGCSWQQQGSKGGQKLWPWRERVGPTGHAGCLRLLEAHPYEGNAESRRGRPSAFRRRGVTRLAEIRWPDRISSETPHKPTGAHQLRDRPRATWPRALRERHGHHVTAKRRGAKELHYTTWDACQPTGDARQPASKRTRGRPPAAFPARLATDLRCAGIRIRGRAGLSPLWPKADGSAKWRPTVVEIRAEPEAAP